MYLADTEIRALLPEMELTCPNSAHQFDESTQVQPCSIDLRISNVFWRPSRRRRIWRRLLPGREHRIDLRHSQIQDLDPLRDWKQSNLKEGDSITLKPGQIAMGRIYERFRVPPGYAGKIEGRSSFARLGLSIHCTGDFVNPGWEGFMPLQLYNAGPYPLRLTPFLSVCQLMLIPLSSTSERSYGDTALQSKYANDDGGPSLWWRDERVRQLQKRLGEFHATERMQQDIIDLVRFENPDVLERFQDYVRRRRVGDVENAEQVLEDFSQREGKLRLADNVAIAAPAVLASAFIGGLFADIGTLQFMLGGLTIASFYAAFSAYVRRGSGYLDAPSLLAARKRPRGES
ncbi:MAG TPA: dCTP deaminase [Solirubrobacteraceae bacterium]|nr:dCTP deaminase [Solirubrobacteraceae bacterium]